MALGDPWIDHKPSAVGQLGCLCKNVAPAVFPHRINVTMKTLLVWFHFMFWLFEENIRSNTRHTTYDDWTSISMYSWKKAALWSYAQ